jgi:hypothetical protein
MRAPGPAANDATICPNRPFIPPKYLPIVPAATGEHMRKNQLVSVLVAVAIGAIFSWAHPASAHHSRTMFDMRKNVTYRGIVKEYRWQNPHSRIVITVQSGATDPSTVGTWNVEASSINIMVSQRWNRTTYKPGDPITVVAHPSTNGSNSVLLFYAIKADGTRLYRAQHRYSLEAE